jgi:hypothetical protein
MLRLTRSTGITLYHSRLRWQGSGCGKWLICGGPCRGRTYLAQVFGPRKDSKGPLIDIQWAGVFQLIDNQRERALPGKVRKYIKHAGKKSYSI